MSVCALWRRLNILGHDVAPLRLTDDGHPPPGMAVVMHPAGPACVSCCGEVESGVAEAIGRKPVDFADRARRAAAAGLWEARQ